MRIIYGRERFKIIPLTNAGLNVTNYMNKRLISRISQPKWDNNRKKLVYTLVTNQLLWMGTNETGYIYHRSRAPDLMDAMASFNYSVGAYENVREDLKDPAKIALKYIDPRKPRVYQIKHINDIMSLNVFTYVLLLKPGKGKTMTACYTIAKLGVRTIIIVLAKYLNKWVSDLKESMELEDGDIYIAVGQRGIENLFTMKDVPKFILISTRTYNNYVNDCNLKNHTYSVRPEDMAAKLGLGYFVVDEGHNEFHVIYKAIVALDIKTLLMSGTFNSKNKYIKTYMEDIFPLEDRKSYLEDVPYLNFVSVSYSLPLSKFENLFIDSINGYSSANYESLIYGPARDRRFRPLESIVGEIGGEKVSIPVSRYNQDYMDFMDDLLVKYTKEKFVNQKKDGHKLIVYSYLVATCVHQVEVLQKEFPDLKIMKYTEGDDFSKIAESDIIVTTVLSSGEAFDIANLFRVFQFINLESDNKNLQASGRLREIKGTELEFYYFYNREIPKHVKYHYHRMNLFSDDAKTYTNIKE